MHFDYPSYPYMLIWLQIQFLPLKLSDIHLNSLFLKHSNFQPRHFHFLNSHTGIYGGFQDFKSNMRSHLSGYPIEDIQGIDQAVIRLETPVESSYWHESKINLWAYRSWACRWCCSLSVVLVLGAVSCGERPGVSCKRNKSRAFHERRLQHFGLDTVRTTPPLLA